LPDASGVVLISRKYRGMTKLSENFVSRMDMDGKLTTLVEGDCAVSLQPKRAIFFQKGDAWFTCDFEGKSLQPVLDGEPKYGFPAASPDGNRVLLMKFGGRNGPRPYIVSLKTKETTAVPVTPGL
jgi:hypothetical protein